jgi:hypothetical protein
MPILLSMAVTAVMATQDEPSVTYNVSPMASVWRLPSMEQMIVRRLDSNSLAPAGVASRLSQFLAMGDWGSDAIGQHLAAAGMGKVAAAIDAKHVIALGDNFYSSGIHTPADGPDQGC